MKFTRNRKKKHGKALCKYIRYRGAGMSKILVRQAYEVGIICNPLIGIRTTKYLSNKNDRDLSSRPHSLRWPCTQTDYLHFVKVSKSQKHFFLKLHCPKIKIFDKSPNFIGQNFVIFWVIEFQEQSAFEIY